MSFQQLWRGNGPVRTAKIGARASIGHRVTEGPLSRDQQAGLTSSLVIIVGRAGPLTYAW